MNPWEIFVNVLSWVGLMLAIFLVLFIVWLFLDALWGQAVKLVQRKQDEIDQYIGEARVLADKYRDETAPEFREGFLAGARWGWGYFHRLRKPKR